jgi:hypothetical protein
METVPEGLVVVVMKGCALLTVKGSQVLIAGLLFASPAYDAWKLYEPGGEGVTGLESGTILPGPTVAVETRVPEPVQALLLNMVYVTVPVIVGNPPEKVAVS